MSHKIPRNKHAPGRWKSLAQSETPPRQIRFDKIANDPVNHPAHYTFGKIEVIDVLEDWQLGFHLANAIKYIARAQHKGRELEDLKKARWYLNRKIQQLEMQAK